MLAKAKATTGQVIVSIAILPHPGLQFRTPKSESNFNSTLERPHGTLACFEGNTLIDGVPFAREVKAHGPGFPFFSCEMGMRLLRVTPRNIPTSFEWCPCDDHLL